jgi:hypothetical protein
LHRSSLTAAFSGQQYDFEIFNPGQVASATNPGLDDAIPPELSDTVGRAFIVSVLRNGKGQYRNPPFALRHLLTTKWWNGHTTRYHVGSE